MFLGTPFLRKTPIKLPIRIVATLIKVPVIILDSFHIGKKSNHTS